MQVSEIRKDFPILSRRVNGKPLVYLDNAATSQKPQVVIEALVGYYAGFNANIHRGVHALAQEATEAYENARKKVQKHINALRAEDVILTSGTTHGINLVASGFAKFLKPKDEIVVSAVEHHSNIVPWQLLRERTGAVLKVIPMDIDGTLDMAAYRRLLSEKTKMVFCNHISNALGTINPIKEIIDLAHAAGAAVLIDGAQACPHLVPDVAALDADFYAGSGHKFCAPTGTGFLYGKQQWLEKLPPYQGGGEMITQVTFEKTTYADLPYKFEAGTPNVGGQIAMGVAIDYLNHIGFDKIAEYETALLHHAVEKLSSIEGLKIYGNAPKKAPVISFNIEGIHPYDVGSVLDSMGIAVRTGHHCAQPIMDFYKIPGTVRASLSFYNTFEEIDALQEALLKACKMFKR